MEENKEKKFVHYSIEFACLQKLKKHRLITEDEYKVIKQRLMSAYQVVSNLVA